MINHSPWLWLTQYIYNRFTALVYIYIYIVCKAKIAYSQNFALKFTDQDNRKCILFAFIILSMFCCYCECSQINVESLQIWNMYYSSHTFIWPKITEYFKSMWAHWRLLLSCSEHFNSASTHHGHLSRTRIYSSTGKFANTYIFQMISHIWDLWMIGEHLDVLYYHKLAVNCPSQTVWLRQWICVNGLSFFWLSD